MSFTEQGRPAGRPQLLFPLLRTGEEDKTAILNLNARYGVVVVERAGWAIGQRQGAPAGPDRPRPGPLFRTPGAVRVLQASNHQKNDSRNRKRAEAGPPGHRRQPPETGALEWTGWVVDQEPEWTARGTTSATG